MPLRNECKTYRQAANLSQQELAEKVHVSRQTISSIERGDYHPSVYLALKIAQALNTDVNQLFFIEGEKYEN